MARREDLRNLAIVAHVDHGKTTLVDALLWQAGSFRDNQDVAERVMDSMDLEREKGITILAKNTAVRLGGTKLNIVDTPGHADFGGEVERGLTMVDGVLLLVDASEGPLPQTRFVLRKALRGAAARRARRQQGRPPRRASAGGRRRGVRAVPRPRRGRVADRVPDRLLQRARRPRRAHAGRPRAPTSGRSSRRCSTTVPPPEYDPDHPLQALVTNLDARPVRRPARALPRSATGRCARAQQIAWCRADGTISNAKVTELFVTDALDRVPADEAGPGEIVALAGLPDVTIGETIADPDDPRPLPVTDRRRAVAVDDDRDQHVAARRHGRRPADGERWSRRGSTRSSSATSRCASVPTERPDAWEVQGRGELQLAILVELMRREGFELTVGKPEVLTREIDGKRHEPVERVAIDVPEEYIGVVTQLLALRKGRLQQMVNHGTGWARMEYLVPARGLIGFRTEFLTETRGTGILHHVFEGWEPWHGELRTRPTGSLVADRRGHDDRVRDPQPAGARLAVRRARASRSTRG